MKLIGDIIGLDLGAARTGLARINTVARLGEPLEPITMRADSGGAGSSHVIDRITRYEPRPCAVVAGVPRGLDGQHTPQTDWALQLISQIRSKLDIPVYEIDEAGTTKAAESIAGENESVDSVAAVLLLEDFLKEVDRGQYEGIHV